MFSLDNIGIFLIFGSVFITMLPTSPFTSILDIVTAVPYLRYINWVLPFTECTVIFELWLTSETVYISLKMLGRWMKISN